MMYVYVEVEYVLQDTFQFNQSKGIQFRLIDVNSYKGKFYDESTEDFPFLNGEYKKVQLVI